MAGKIAVISVRLRRGGSKKRKMAKEDGGGGGGGGRRRRRRKREILQKNKQGNTPYLEGRTTTKLWRHSTHWKVRRGNEK